MKSIDIEGNSLPDSRQALRGQINSDEEVILEEVLVEGASGSADGSADSVETAVATAKRKVPNGALIVSQKVRREPTREICRVSGYIETEAKKSIQLSNGQRIDATTIERPGRQGFLGIGRRPYVFAVTVVQSAEVRVTWLKKTKVRFCVGTPEQKRGIDSDDIPSEAHQAEVHQAAELYLSGLSRFDSREGQPILSSCEAEIKRASARELTDLLMAVLIDPTKMSPGEVVAKLVSQKAIERYRKSYDEFAESDPVLKGLLDRLRDDFVMALEVTDEAMVRYKNAPETWPLGALGKMFLGMQWEASRHEVDRLRSGRKRETTTPILRGGGRRVMASSQQANKALVIAAERGDLAGVQSALGQGADLSAVDPNGSTGLYFAAANGHSAIVDFLLEKGANARCVNNFGESALFPATLGGHTSILEKLLERGVDPNAKDTKARTVLLVAAIAGQTALAETLLKAGANPNVEIQGHSILKFAMSLGKTDIVDLLKAHNTRP